jgi:hypothetical protein
MPHVIMEKVLVHSTPKVNAFCAELHYMTHSSEKKGTDDS